MQGRVEENNYVTPFYSTDEKENKHNSYLLHITDDFRSIIDGHKETFRGPDQSKANKYVSCKWFNLPKGWI